MKCVETNVVDIIHRQAVATKAANIYTWQWRHGADILPKTSLPTVAAEVRFAKS